MRTAFIKTLEEEALNNEKINLLVGDLGFGVVMDFAKRFPDRFLNPGVAEQNMTGIAAGLAMTDKIVFTYSIANFPTIRPYEQIRNDICYHNANVKVVAVGGGFCYGALGPTHFATEDIAALRVLPNMVVVAPGDPWEARAATKALIGYNGPAYLRLGRAGEPEVHSGEIDFPFGKAIVIKEGSDITLISTGGMLYNIVKASEKLEKQGISVRVVSMPFIKPLDEAAIIESVNNTGCLLTVEEHSVIGGLGSAVSEVIAESGQNTKFKRLGMPSQFPDRVGSQDFLKNKYGLDVDSIVNSALSIIND
jgi:transketolase